MTTLATTLHVCEAVGGSAINTADDFDDNGVVLCCAQGSDNGGFNFVRHLS